MQTFAEWVLENHPEIIEENWKSKLGALALAGSSFFPQYNAQAEHPTAITQQDNQSRLNAMQKVSKLHRFAKNWKSEFNEKEIFDVILKLQTEKDHDDFIEKVTKDMQEMVQFQMRGRTHPNPDIQKSEVRNIQNSYKYQYLDYIRTLAFASKMN